MCAGRVQKRKAPFVAGCRTACRIIRANLRKLFPPHGETFVSKDKTHHRNETETSNLLLSGCY